MTQNILEVQYHKREQNDARDTELIPLIFNLYYLIVFKYYSYSTFF